MKLITFLILSLDLSLNLSLKTAFAQVEYVQLPETGKSEPIEQRVVLKHSFVPQGYDKPVLLLLPGVNRGYLRSDNILGVLQQNNIAFVAMNFSTHPIAVNGLKYGVEPYFRSKDFTVEDYAFEVNFMASEIKREFGLEAIPVTLSFSSSVSRALKNFDIIVDISPFTTVKDANPNLATYQTSLEFANMFNPMRTYVIRSAMDQAYRLAWNPVVKSYIEGYKLKEDRKDDFMEGYLSSSRSLEKLELEKPDATTTKRFFILAEGEKESLQKGQLNLLKAHVDAKTDTACFFVRGGKHALPMSNPLEIAQILKIILEQTENIQSGCYDVKKHNDFEHLEFEALPTLISKD